MPFWSCSIGYSKALLCLLVHRDHYHELKSKGESIRLITRLAPFLSFPSFLASLVAPFHVCLLSQYSYAEQASEKYATGLQMYHFCVLAISFPGLLGVLYFISGQTGELAIDASVVAVRGLIFEMQKPERDWSKILEQHWFLDKALGNVWGVNQVGGLWLFRTCLLFVMGFAFGAYSLSIPHSSWHYILIGVGFVMSLAGVQMLFLLAKITDLCQNSRVGHESVIAVANEQMILGESWEDRCKRDMPPSEDVDVEAAAQMELKGPHLRYLEKNQMGVTILGVLVTYQLVFDIFMKTAVYLPVAFGIAGQVLRGSTTPF
jgi:hypothetical protein